MDVDLDRINDIETLRTVAKSFEANWRKAEARLQRLEAEFARLDDRQQKLSLASEIETLKHQLANRNRVIFGDKSEKRGDKKTPTTKIPQAGHGPTPQPELEEIEQVHVLDAADQVCLSCGGALEEWEGQEEETEEIEVVARRFIRVKHRRKKYRCKCGGCVETALGPKKLIAGGRYSTNFAVHVVTDKYADHSPLERQSRSMRRDGLRVTSQALWDQVYALSRALRPAYEQLLEYLRQKPVLGADETHWKVMKKGQSKRWHVWALCAEDAVVYQIEDSRSAQTADKVFGDFSGTAVTDGYAAYGAVKKRRPSMRLAHCWAHARRKFNELEEICPDEVGEALDLIAALFKVEREARASPDVVEARRRLRKEKSEQIIRGIQNWALQVEAPRESPLRKAVEYMGKLWPGLTLFLEDPLIDIDNNAVERALRGIVIGRKNHYGSKSRRGTEAAAILYSLIESAKLAGVAPDKYLREAANAAIEGSRIPLPHELSARA